MRKISLRVPLVWLCLSFFLALFLFGEGGLLQIAARIQVVPAFLRWGFSILLFAGMALLAGRFYCSLLCPLGLFQDAANSIGRRRMPGYRKASVLRYWILAATLVSLVSGSLLFIQLLDPFSNFGRGVTQVIRPVLVCVNNLLALLPLPKGALSYIHHLPPPPVYLPAAFASAAFFGMLAFWSWFRGRPFCDHLCPVGTFLGLFSSHPVLAVRLRESACSGCGKCETVCPTGCLSGKTGIVETDRCVVCLACVNACPNGALGLGFIRPGERIERRDLLRSGLGLGAGLALAFTPAVRVFRAGKLGAKAEGSPISPPGSGSHERFHGLCVACSSCVKACPAGIIRPSLTTWGPSGVFQPHLDYDFGYCQYECRACTAACPTGAIEPLSLEAKKRVQIGLASFRKNSCIVVKNGTSCGACAEHCPTQAAHMVPYGQGLSIPEVDASLCIGCGACHFACPATPKAMVVGGLPTHGRTRLASEPGEGPVLAPLEEFPF